MLLEKIKADLKEAMKNKENEKKDTLKLVLASAQSIAKNEKREVVDKDVLEAFLKETKQTKQALKIAEDGGKTESDFYKKNKDALSLLESYLPKQLTEEEATVEIQKILDKVSQENGGILNKGVVMKEVMTELKNKMEGKELSKLVNKLLNS